MGIVKKQAADNEVQREGPDAATRERRSVNKQILHNLAVLGGKLTTEEDIVFSGTKIVLPAGSNLKIARATIDRAISEAEEETTFSQTYKFRPWDGAYATLSALRKQFGVVGQEATYSIFGKNPPQLITINTGPNETTQVPWGAISIPLMPDVTFYTGAVGDEELGSVFRLSAKGPKGRRFEIQGVFKLIQEELEVNSIYRGKAFDGRDMPEFYNPASLDPESVVYSEHVLAQLEANVWSLLEYTQQNRDMGLPLKRATLLEGPYGTGKTLAAMLTAQRAVNNGWTFIMCRPGRDDLINTMNTARMYQPAVVFFEDVDTLVDGETAVTKILDLVDGLPAKNSEILCVFTTNHKEKIHKGMLRPGRLDSIISIGALDVHGVEKLVTVTVPRDKLDKNIDWQKVFEYMQDFMPAFVKEAIDRSVRYSMSRNGGVVSTITTQDLCEAAEGLRPQLEWHQNAHEGKNRPTVDTAIADVVTKTMSGMAVVDNDYLFKTAEGRLFGSKILPAEQIRE